TGTPLQPLDLTWFLDTPESNNFWSVRYSGCNTAFIRTIILQMLRERGGNAVAETANELITLPKVKEVFVTILQQRGVLTIASREQRITPWKLLACANPPVTIRSPA
ncbi:MAG: hypothetical protein K5Q00_07265, partial [Gammaproteobacteria bacterium]|nr:hypothetical protein [Gammaproteobacteria bacterium]